MATLKLPPNEVEYQIQAFYDSFPTDFKPSFRKVAEHFSVSHNLVTKVLNPERYKEILEYQKQWNSKKSDQEIANINQKILRRKKRLMGISTHKITTEAQKKELERQIEELEQEKKARKKALCQKDTPQKT